MKELIDLIVAKAELDPAKAELAAQTVMTYLKERAPNALHKHLDKMAAGEQLSGSIKEDFAHTAGEVKDKTVEAIRDMADAAENAATQLRAKLDDFWKKSGK